MAKKKILFVVEAMGGGVFTYIVDLANEMVKTYDMYIAYVVRPQTPENYREYFNNRIHLIEVKNFTRFIHPVKDLKMIPEVKKIAKKVQPDILHLHSSKAGVIARITFNGMDVPLLYIPHGYSFLMENYKPAKRAMYMKKLCVANDVIGNHDVAHNGENGFVCRTIERFKKAIDTSTTDRIIDAAYNDIENIYNTSVMGEKYAKIYRRGGQHLVFAVFPVLFERIGYSTAREAVAA